MRILLHFEKPTCTEAEEYLKEVEKFFKNPRQWDLESQANFLISQATGLHMRMYDLALFSGQLDCERERKEADTKRLTDLQDAIQEGVNRLIEFCYVEKCDIENAKLAWKEALPPPPKNERGREQYPNIHR